MKKCSFLLLLSVSMLAMSSLTASAKAGYAYQSGKKPSKRIVTTTDTYVYNNTGNTFGYIYLISSTSTVGFPWSLSANSQGSGNAPFDYDSDQDIDIRLRVDHAPEDRQVTVDIYLDVDPAVYPGSPYDSFTISGTGSFSHTLTGTTYPPFYGAIYLDIHY